MNSTSKNHFMLWPYHKVRSELQAVSNNGLSLTKIMAGKGKVSDRRTDDVILRAHRYVVRMAHRTSMEADGSRNIMR